MAPSAGTRPEEPHALSSPKSVGPQCCSARSASGGAARVPPGKAPRGNTLRLGTLLQLCWGKEHSPGEQAGGALQTGTQPSLIWDIAS